MNNNYLNSVYKYMLVGFAVFSIAIGFVLYSDRISLDLTRSDAATPFVDLAASPSQGVGEFTTILTVTADVQEHETGDPVSMYLWFDCENDTVSVAEATTACGELPQAPFSECAENALGYMCNQAQDIEGFSHQVTHVYPETPQIHTAKVIISGGINSILDPGEDRTTITVLEQPASTPTYTPTFTPNVTPHASPADTATGIPTYTPIDIPQGSATPTVTPDNKITSTPVSTPSDTPTHTPTYTPTNAVPTPTRITGGGIKFTTLSIDKKGRNITRYGPSGVLREEIPVLAGDIVEFVIKISNSEEYFAFSSFFKDQLPGGVTYVEGSTYVDDKPADQDGVTQPVMLRVIDPGKTKTVRLRVKIEDSEDFRVGAMLRNESMVYSDNSNTAYDDAFLKPVSEIPAPADPLECVAVTRRVDIGEQALFAASGGSGEYEWSAPGGKPDIQGESFDSVFVTTYSSYGRKAAVVRSGDLFKSCVVFVRAPAVSSGSVDTPAFTPTFVLNQPTVTHTTTTRGQDSNKTAELDVILLGSNLSQMQTYPSTSIVGEPGDKLQFLLRVRSLSAESIHGIVLHSELPEGIYYEVDSTYVEGVKTHDGITEQKGLMIGDFSPREEKRITFVASIYPLYIVENDSNIVNVNARAISQEGLRDEDELPVYIVRECPLGGCIPIGSNTLLLSLLVAVVAMFAYVGITGSVTLLSPSGFVGRSIGIGYLSRHVSRKDLKMLLISLFAVVAIFTVFELIALTGTSFDIINNGEIEKSQILDIVRDLLPG